MRVTSGGAGANVSLVLHGAPGDGSPQQHQEQYRQRVDGRFETEIGVGPGSGAREVC